MTYICHHFATVLLSLEAPHWSHCLFDPDEQIFQTLSEAQPRGVQNTLSVPQQCQMQDVGHKMSKEHSVLTAVDVQLPI